jgi:hypothetical protein
MLRTLVAFALFLSAFCVGYAQDSPCADPEAKQALTEADTLRSWDSLYKSFRLYRNCDDGAIAEGYSESVARILVDHWDTLPRLAELAKKSDKFWHFVLKHVDATENPDDLQKIKLNSIRRCPAGLRLVCGDLGRAADSAIKDLAPEQREPPLE